MDVNNKALAKALTFIVMGKDYRTSNKKRLPTWKFFWGWIRKCRFGL